jgi:two-component system sensor histidine kinase BaeS
MKSLWSKLLLAQVLAVVLALLVVTVITRVSLNRGFMDFLQQQESMLLDYMAPALSELYEARGGWGFLEEHPRSWDRVLHSVRPLTGPRGGRPFANGPGGPRTPPPGDRFARSMGALDRLHVRERLFLLDERRRHLAGPRVDTAETRSLAPVESRGEIVAWVGFAPMRSVTSPEARGFLRRQRWILTASLAVGLSLAAALAFVLSRHLSRPVQQLDATVLELTQGDYASRAEVASRDELGRLARNVNQLAETLEESRSTRRRWIADIAHELRTPVAILKGELEALADGIRPPDEGSAASLREEVDHLASLVDDLQALAMSDSGELKLRPAALDLSELVRDTVAPFEERLAGRRIHLQMHLEPSLAVTADRQRIRQLVHNLMENESRYAEPGATMKVQLVGASATARLLIEDSGPGVDDEQLASLFDRFYRGEGSRSRATGGSGLGLSICRSIAEAHGGTIRAEHSPLGGLRITVELPA